MPTVLVEPRTELRPVRECPRCRHKWPPDWEYCRNCVVWLPGHEAVERITRLVPAAGDSAAEFAAMLGSVFLACELRLSSEHLPAQEIAHARAIIERVITAIESCGGNWSFVAGRGVMGHWTNAETGTNAAARLAERALANAPSVIEHSSPHTSPTLQMGIVAVGEETSSAKQAYRLAIRLASLALPNTALFSNTAYERLVDRFDFQGVQPVIPRSESLGPVFRLLHRKHERSGTHHIGPEKIPIIGRQGLLDALVGYRSDVARGQSMVLHLVGEPGLGKSKLLREWLAASEAAGQLAEWLKFACYGVPYGGYPFRAWQLLFSECGAADTDRINHVDAVVEMLKHRQAPGLIVVDDFHWIDLESRSLIAELIAAGWSAPMMLVLAYRPSFTPQLAVNAQVPQHRLRLQGLRHDELSSLFNTLIGKAGIEVPTSFRDEILANGAGSPLYVEEAVEHVTAVAKSGAQNAKLPPSLIELLILRVTWALERTLPALRRRQRDWLSGPLWTGPSEANLDILRDLESLEEQLSSWLDRLDVIEDDVSSARVQEFLSGLQKVDQELGLLNLLVGRQRPHRGRLAQTLSRIARLNSLKVRLK